MGGGLAARGGSGRTCKSTVASGMILLSSSSGCEAAAAAATASCAANESGSAAWNQHHVIARASLRKLEGSEKACDACKRQIATAHRAHDNHSNRNCETASHGSHLAVGVVGMARARDISRVADLGCPQRCCEPRRSSLRQRGCVASAAKAMAPAPEACHVEAKKCLGRTSRLIGTAFLVRYFL